jgi:L-cysteine desulfidase
MKLKLLNLLQKEMILALGCTEPVALAYAGSVVTKYLNSPPERMVIRCSPNIIKNVKSVTVPNTNGMKGIDVACIIGAFFGDPEKGLEVLTGMDDEKISLCNSIVNKVPCTIEVLESTSTLHFILEGYQENNVVSVEVKDEHTNIVQISKNGNIIKEAHKENKEKNSAGVINGYTIKDIIEFSRTLDYTPLITLLEQSIKFNLAIANEGLQNNYGINVGKTILQTDGDHVRTQAKGYASAASDARMSGCSLPVMINSGSGNQGITVSVPVIIYARHINASRDSLFRALILSNLIAIYEKSFIGKLSAFCGVVCASSGAAGGITFLRKGSDEQIESSVINTIGTLSGMVCDGAKASCASKIATCVDTAFTCVDMALRNQRISPGDGIVKNGLDNTVISVGHLACDGMRITDQVILKIMLEDE